MLAAKPQREYADTASLPEIDRRLRLRVLAEGEHLLPTNELRAVTLARMQALLQMNRELPHEAMTRIVDSFEAVMDQIPGRLAMRCVEMVLTLVREFTLAEQERLRRLVPGVLKPRPVNDYGGRRLASRQHPMWTFWKR